MQEKSQLFFIVSAEIKADLLTAVLHYCGDSELTNGKTIVKNSKLTNGIAFFPQQMQSHKTLYASLKRHYKK